jgi:hypothetical protein
VTVRAETVAEISQTAEREGAVARFLGGIGIQLRCKSAQPGGPLARECGDIDIATTHESARAIKTVLQAHGYEPAVRFNALHGRTRMLFHGPEGDHADVFIDSFRMCHTLELRPRLKLDARTLPLADLLLTKLQIAELNRKDASDMAALLIDYELTSDESGINMGYVADILRKDWGWWRTVSANLDRLTEVVPTLSLSEEDAQRAGERAQAVRERVDAAPKTSRWKIRARVGDRVPWRDEPEEI